MRDPLGGDDEFVEIGRRSQRSAKKLVTELLAVAADEGDDIDRICAFQTTTDFGNGNRLILRFGEDLMFIDNIGWFIWNGVRWDCEGGQSGAIKLAHRVGQAILYDETKALKEKPGAANDERVARLYAHGIQSLNQARAHSTLSAAAPYLARSVNDLDAELFLITAKNGTIILTSHCELRDAMRGDLITPSLGVNYRAGADCPKFKQFLARIMPDPEMRAFLRRIFGYGLTGSTREHKLLIFYGTGRNGKSTLINVIRSVMGDYAASTPVSTFLSQSRGGAGSDASPDLARLPGVRLVTAAEPPEGARLDESKVKEMTGGDPMTVRHLNQGFFEFRPKFKAVISTNHRPTIRGTDQGIWSRINLVPFTVQIPEHEIDRELESKLIAEGEGILQWMLDGAEEWFANGLQPPAKAIAAVEDYRADEDPVGEFLKSRCEFFPADYVNPRTKRQWETSQKRMREVYLEWCKDEGLDPLATKTFGSKLTGRGVVRRKSGGLTFYVGLVIKGEAPGEVDA